MSRPIASIRAEAIRLHAYYGALLRPEAATEAPGEAEEACDAIDAARARLQGGEKAEADQLSLDLRAR